MNILGISHGSHDASATIVCDGSIIASAAEERFTKQKHDPSFPEASIEFCLKMAGLSPNDIDFVAYHEEPIAKFSRNFSLLFSYWPHSISAFVESMKQSITSEIWLRQKISKHLDLNPEKVFFIPHHLSHAAHAFYTSPFEESAILTVDAVGEWASTGFFSGNKSDNSALKALDLVPFPHSLGLVYSAFTSFLGFRANFDECSTMALAQFGLPRYIEQIRSIIKLTDTAYTVDMSYFDLSKQSTLPVSNKFISVFGRPRNPKELLTFNCLKDNQTASNDEQRFADIASSIQLALEETLLHLAKRIQKMIGSKNLCLAGGVALNCVANSKLANSGIFEKIYVPTDPGDGGGAMGAALYLASVKKENISCESPSPYLGKEISTKELELVAKALFSDQKFSVKKISGHREIALASAKLISEKKILGWVQGRFENGPRALGARSILADPSDIKVAERLSRTIKERASFRPYACSMTESASHLLLEDNTEASRLLNRWMLSTVKVKSQSINALRAATHINHTTRVQIVTERDHALFHLLLKEVGVLSGVEAVLNTSFNEREFPIVNTAYDALLCLMKTPLDALLIGDLLIERN